MTAVTEASTTVIIKEMTDKEIKNLKLITNKVEGIFGRIL